MERKINYKTNALEVSKWFLSNDKKGDGFSNKQLQKLLFLSYGFYLVLFNDDPKEISSALFKNKFEAWIHGPVYPSIYREFKQFGFNKILYSGEVKIEDEQIIKVLDFVIKNFGNLTGYELENISHNLNSWVKARGNLDSFESSNKKIDDVDIFGDFVKYVK